MTLTNLSLREGTKVRVRLLSFLLSTFYFLPPAFLFSLVLIVSSDPYCSDPL